MSGEQRLRVALDLSDTVRSVRMAGLKAQFPGDTQQQLVRRYIEQVYGLRLPESW
jgi:hypothetical protein